MSNIPQWVRDHRIPTVRTYVRGPNIILLDGCPYCNQTHYHGHAGRALDYEGGHRGAHCSNVGANAVPNGVNDDGYYLLPPEFAE